MQTKPVLILTIFLIILSLFAFACTTDAEIKVDAKAGSGDSDVGSENKADVNVDADSSVTIVNDISTDVYINEIKLTEAQIDVLTRTYGRAPVGGRYWYDSKSGFYGVWHGSTLGVLNAGHNFGTLNADASDGDTGVFFNGRELPREDVQAFELIFGVPLVPGRAWMDAQGNIGTEGSDVPIVNLYLAYSQRVNANTGGSNTNYGSGYGSSGDNYWAGNFNSYGNEEGGFGYVMVDGASVTYGG